MATATTSHSCSSSIKMWFSEDDIFNRGATPKPYITSKSVLARKKTVEECGFHDCSDMEDNNENGNENENSKENEFDQHKAVTPISFYHPDNDKIFPEQSWYNANRYHQYAQHNRKPNVSAAFIHATNACPSSFRGTMKYHANAKQKTQAYLSNIDNERHTKNQSGHKHNLEKNEKTLTSQHDDHVHNSSEKQRRGTIELYIELKDKAKARQRRLKKEQRKKEKQISQNEAKFQEKLSRIKEQQEREIELKKYQKHKLNRKMSDDLIKNNKYSYYNHDHHSTQSNHSNHSKHVNSNSKSKSKSKSKQQHTHMKRHCSDLGSTITNETRMKHKNKNKNKVTPSLLMSKSVDYNMDDDNIAAPMGCTTDDVISIVNTDTAEGEMEPIEIESESNQDCDIPTTIGVTKTKTKAVRKTIAKTKTESKQTKSKKASKKSEKKPKLALRGMKKENIKSSAKSRHKKVETNEKSKKLRRNAVNYYQ